jgi:hypothetical protein
MNGGSAHVANLAGRRAHERRRGGRENSAPTPRHMQGGTSKGAAAFRAAGQPPPAAGRPSPAAGARQQQSRRAAGVTVTTPGPAPAGSPSTSHTNEASGGPTPGRRPGGPPPGLPAAAAAGRGPRRAAAGAPPAPGAGAATPGLGPGAAAHTSRLLRASQALTPLTPSMRPDRSRWPVRRRRGAGVHQVAAAAAGPGGVAVRRERLLGWLAAPLLKPRTPVQARHAGAAAGHAVRPAHL